MNNSDPTIIGLNADTSEREFTVEDIMQMQAEEGVQTDALNDTEPTGVAGVVGQPVLLQPNLPQPNIPQPNIPQPNIPILPLPKRRVSGRYRSSGGGFQLELRVDVDGARPMRKVSGDFFQTTGGTTSYFGSFIVNSPVITVTTTLVTIEGLGNFTFAAGFPKVRVTIPRVSLFAPPAAATVRFLSPANAPGALYSCAFVSQYFRSVQIEQDRCPGTTLFTSYNTGSLPAPGPVRNLSVVTSFAEAGIEMVPAGITNLIPSNAATAGPDLEWNDAELHNAMTANFSLWQNVPQWKVWLFLATRYDGGGVRGIMFDQQGKQRQGCAVFHDAVGGATPEVQRAMLRTYVHELGHCFNLLHSWQKSLAVPPAPNRPAARSWMNYPQNYPGGTPAYWAAFNFEFDDLEVVHLRHGYRNNVIMGGNNFTIGSADPMAFDAPIEDNSGLQLEINARKRFSFAEPVVVEIKLSTTDLRGKTVTPYLHPKQGFVKIGICKPGGNVEVFEPLIEQCTDDATITLDASNPSITDSAYIGYGKDGFYFDQAGIYQLRAIYHACDGSIITSNTIALRVAHPVTANDESVAELYLGDEQGVLFTLLGSDSKYLEHGNAAFDEVLDKHSKHPLAVYAEMVKGYNATREFKDVAVDKKITMRTPKHQVGTKLLTAVVDSPEAAKLIDSVTMDQVINRLATTQEAMGDEKSAKATLKKASGKAVKAAGR